MKITVVNIGSERNKGTAAITFGMLRLLKKLFPNVHITCVSLYPSVDMTYKITKRFFPEVNIVGNLKPVYSSSASKFMESLKVLAFKGVPIRRYLEHPAIRAIQKSDLVIARSSPIFRSKSPFLNYSAAHASIPLYVAQKLNVPYGFAPQTFWPVRGLQARKIIRDLGKRAAFVFVRDVYSFGELSRIGLEPILCLDTGFWLEPIKTKWDAIAPKLDLKEGEFIIVVPRSTGSKATDKLVYQNIARVLKDLRKKIVVVCHNFDVDIESTQSLYSQLKRMDIDVTMLPNEEWSPEELAGFYAYGAVIVGMRVHSIIMGLVAGIPVIGIDIDGRMRAILKTCGLDKFAIFVNRLEENKLKEKIEMAVSDRQSLSQLIVQYIKIQKEIDEMKWYQAVEAIK